MSQSYELRTEPAPEGLAQAFGGASAELREVSYGRMRRVMAEAEEPGESSDRLLGAVLHVDGEPIGFERLQAVPGRFSSLVYAALTATMRMHDLVKGDKADGGDERPNG